MHCLMDTQLTGFRKRKSLDEQGCSESVGSDYKPGYYENEKTESLDCAGPSVNIEAMDESHAVKASPVAPVNVESQDDLVSQHAKVAEEAIAGWEKAEIEAMILKQQLESFSKTNSSLEDRVNHFDGALKEVVTKLRLANEEHEMKIQEFVNQISQLQSQIDSYRTENSSLCRKLEFVEEENVTLKMELKSQLEELEIRTIERDLSTEAAEKSSKLNLESIKKVARLEAECRRLRSAAHTSLSYHSDQKFSTASSFSADSLPESQSDNGERLQSTDTDFQNNVTLKSIECLITSCSYSDASLESGNVLKKTRAMSGIEMDLLDDFLEIERLAALPEIVSNQSSNSDEFSLEEERSRADKLEEKIAITEAEKVELENELEKIKQQKAETEDSLKNTLQANHQLEEKLTRMEMEKSELEHALAKTESSSGLLTVQIQEAEMKQNKLQKELNAALETQQSYKSQVMGYELEAKIMSSRVEMLEFKLKAEKDLSAELTVRCEDMEDELFRTKQEFELLQSTISSSQLKIKQDDLTAAAGKLAECQQTIASLGIQLKSLASLDEFLTDTSNSQESIKVLGSDNSHLLVREQLQHDDSSRKARNSNDASAAKGDSPASSSSSSSSSTSSVSQVSSEKGRNGFIKLFSRSNRVKVDA